jgi:hypothetical protein
VLCILGAGRAARAQLVDAQMPDGSIVRCVEKVFAPGRLTRWIYRAAFAAPFAYQTNRNAILASFYRRRVAAAVMATSDIGVDVASPIYVRYCAESKAWVLAAEWIDGRGIRPLPAHRSRVREWLDKDRAAFYSRLSLRERVKKRYFRGAKDDTKFPLGPKAGSAQG